MPFIPQALNNSNAEIGEIALALEAVFIIDLNNYYRSSMEIEMRKNNRTKFFRSAKRKVG